MCPDNKARETALDPTRSFIVQAPAGSGKTELLTQRYLKCLARVERAPEEILAVTFTRKAAAEMRDRILAALDLAKHNASPPHSAHERLTWELARDVLARDKKENWELVQHVHRLKIVTIDALCAYIVTKMPILSHIGSMPEVVEDPRRLYEEAIDWLCLKTQDADPWAGALMKLYWHFDNRLPKIQKCFSAMLAKRDQWLPFLDKLNADPKLLEQTFSESLTRIRKTHFRQLQVELSSEEWKQTLSLLRQAAKTAHKVDPNGNIGCCIDCPEEIGLQSEDLPYWKGIRALLLTQSGSWRKRWTEKEGFPPKSRAKTPEEKSLFEANKNAIADLVYDFSEKEAFRCLLDEVLDLPDPTLNDEQLSLLQALGELLRVLVGSLQLVFQQRGQVDFIEIALRALEALGNEGAPTDIALFLDHRLKHILIDEYQDTSVIQNRIFEKLIAEWQPEDKRTVFLVGDPMQSIYRFRGAEVSLFILTQKNGLGSLSLTPLTLTQNFRSQSQVVNWINERFDKLFPDKPDPALGAVPFTQAQSVNDAPDQSGVLCHPVNEQHLEHDDKVLSIIQASLAKAPQDYTIAVLARTKKHLMGLVSRLKSARIPFIAHEVDRFSTREHVMDYMTLFTALCDVSDRIAWYAFCRSPLIGLSLNDLLTLHEADPNALLWTTLRTHSTLALSEDAQNRLSRVVPLVQYWLQHQKRHHRDQWVRGLWVALGGYDIYPGQHNQADLDKVDALIEQFSSMDITLALPLITERIAVATLDAEAVSEQPDEVKSPVVLMTIHKAKGLEFDEVILPHMHLGSRRDEPGLMEWVERHHENGIDLLFATQRSHEAESDKLYDFVRKQISKKQQFESVRLLYVALTRARHKCHLVGSCHIDSEKGYIKPPANAFWSMLFQADEIESIINAKDDELITTKDTFSEQHDGQLKQQALKRLPIHWEPPKILQTKLHEMQVTASDDADLNYPEQGDPVARALGTVFHRVMEHYGAHLLTLQDKVSTLRNSVALPLRRFGLMGDIQEKALSLILQGIDNMLSDPKGQWILDSQHRQRRSEWPLTYKVGQKTENVILDVSFVDKDNVRWIVDYKMTQSDLNQSELLDEEIMRYLPQLKQYQRAVSQLGDSVVKIGLYFPLMPKWCEL